MAYNFAAKQAAAKTFRQSGKTLAEVSALTGVGIGALKVMLAGVVLTKTQKTAALVRVKTAQTVAKKRP